MEQKGKHASGGPGAFYRDLAIMVVGILLVGAAVFFLLFLLADNPSASTTTSAAAAPTTTTEAITTTEASSTSTSSSTSSTTSTTVPVRSPEEVRVAVLNSMGLDGAAGRMTETLSEAGYQTLPPDDYLPEQDPSRIWYRDGFSAEANGLLAFLPGALVESLPDEDLMPGADVILVLGTGYEE